MPVVVVGLNYRAAPVEIRERVTFAPAQQPAALTSLLRRAREGVLLSTCNRTEVYAVVERGASGAHSIGNFLGQFHGLPPRTLAPYLCRWEGAAAVSHLFAVAAGLDSMILGEPQILGQVRTAYEAAAANGAAGPVLSWIFHRALKVGKQVRSDTEISRNAVSVSSAAVELARQTVGGLAGRSVLVVGAGEMGELAAKALRGNGPREIVVTNRTYSRAVELAERCGGQAAEFPRLPELVAAADVIVTSTGASGFILTRALVQQATQGRHDRPLCLIDIAVPRDVDPAVGELGGVALYDVDDLQAVCATNLEGRRKETARAQEIVDAEVAAFQAWWEGLEVVPTIAALRQRAEEIRQAELQKALARLGELTERERWTLDALTSAIVNKMLHQPTARLKAESSGGNGTEYVRTVRKLFALDEEA